MQRNRHRGFVLVSVLWMSALLIGFLALISQNAQTNAGVAVAISSNRAEDLAIQSAMAMIRKGMIDWKMLGGEFDIGAVREAILTQPQWPQGLDFAIIPNTSKINLKHLTLSSMRSILERRKNVDAGEIDGLIQAWTDWVDADDNAMPQGAERSYYAGEGIYNMPANNFFQVPAELLFVRGYKAAFSDVDVNAVFTVYGKHQGVDFGSASRQTLQLIPGMTDETIELILTSRKTLDLSKRSELSLLLDAAVYIEVQPWIAEGAVNNIFTLAVFPASQDAPEYAYMEDIEFDPFWIGAKTLSVKPMARIGEY
ncbi:MAG: general secretion pathway protein GspK [Gammaproteobacteria bacterium]|nr:general secretion pathway protein GspK [Gammaproteobacteria bacterium]